MEEKKLPKKHSVLLYFYSLKKLGGAEKMLVALANHLFAKNIDVHILTLDNENVPHVFDIQPGVKIHKIGHASKPTSKLLKILRITKIIRNHRIKSLIGFVMSADKTIYASAKITNVRLIVAERNAPSMYRARYSLLQKLIIFNLMRLADFITVQNKRFIEQYPNNIQHKIIEIPNPIFIPKEQCKPSKPKKNGRFNLIYVGRIDDFQKNVTCLVRAFSIVAKKNHLWDLKIIGDGPDLDNIRREIRYLEIEKRVELQGTKKEIKEDFLQGNLFVIPSKWEGFPNSLAEAMSYGLPSVGFSEADGVCELISENTGWLANTEKEHHSLAEALNTAMLNHAERDQKGKNARKSAENFHPAEQLDKWLKLL